MLPKNRGDREYFRFFQDNVAYTNDAGTAVAIGSFVGGQYNLVAPTYADGDPVVFQFTSSGLLKTDASLTVEGDIQIGAVELKDATTDTRAVVKTDGTNNALVVTMNALPALVAGSATVGDVTVSSLPALVAGTATIGSVKLTDGAETLQIATDGAAVKTKGIMVMGTDGTNAQTISVASDGDVNIADGGNVITTDGSGTAGSAAGGVLTIQGVSSMTPVQVGDNSSSLSIDIGGQAPQLDDTDKIAVSLYGKGTAAGDTALDVDTDGHLQLDVLSMPSLEIGEFPAAAAITDNFANPTTTNIMAMGMVYDGSTWDRMLGDSTNGVLVNLGANNDVTITSGTITTITNAVAVTDAITGGWDNTASDGASVSGDVAHDAADAGEPVKIGGKASSTVPTAVSTGDRVNAYFDANGYLMVGIGDGVDRALVDSAGNLMVSLGTEISGEDVANDVLMVGGKIAHDAAIANVNPVFIGAEAADFDGAALPNAVNAELDAVRLKASLNGVLYVMPLSEDGSGIANIKIQNNASDVVTGVSGTYDTLDVSISDGTDRLAIDGSGNIAVTQSGTWNVGTVTTLTGITNTVTVTGDSAGSLTIDNATLSVVGTGAEASALRVTIATDSTGVLSVDDNGGALTVDGTVSIGAGTAAIGKLLPPDIDVTTHTNYIRKYFAGTGAQTDAIIWSPAAGKRWHIVSMYVQTSAAATITLEDDKVGGDDPVWQGAFADNQGMTIQFGEKYPLASSEDAADLILTTSAANSVVVCTGYEI